MAIKKFIDNVANENNLNESMSLIETCTGSDNCDESL